MRLSQEAMIELMSYADGELEGDQRTRVEKLVSEDADAARFVSEIAGLGDEIRFAIEDRDGPRMALADGIADRVLGSIGDKPVARLDDLRARRLKASAAVVAVLALAASAFFLLRTQASPTAETLPDSNHTPIATQAPSAGHPPAALSFGSGVDVDHIESPAHRVSVFYLPTTAHNTSASVVVWIDDKSGGGE